MIKSVLVVDDDLANRMLPGLILGTEKYQVSECADGTQALKLLSEKKIRLCIARYLFAQDQWDRNLQNHTRQP